MCPTRWSSRVDYLKAVRDRFVDILKVLTRISLESKEPMERTEAIGMKKKIETYEFIVFIIFWERLLITINKASENCKQTQLTCLQQLPFCQWRSDNCSIYASLGRSADISATRWNITLEFRTERFRTNKKLTIDQLLHEPASKFRLTVFNTIVDTALRQLEIRFKGQKLVTESF